MPARVQAPCRKGASTHSRGNSQRVNCCRLEALLQAVAPSHKNAAFFALFSGTRHPTLTQLPPAPPPLPQPQPEQPLPCQQGLVGGYRAHTIVTAEVTISCLLPHPVVALCVAARTSGHHRWSLFDTPCAGTVSQSVVGWWSC